LKKYFKDLIDTSSRYILAGDTISIPTDTFYGLSCNSLDARAVKKLFNIKFRDITNPVPLLVSSVEHAKEFGAKFYGLERLVEKFWPGPLTLLMETKYSFPENMVKKEGLVGFRVPDLEFPIKLIEKIGFPLSGTSANISGSTETKNIEQVKKYFPGSQVSHFVDLPCGQGIKPSTVARIHSGRVNILRQGTISKSLIESFL
jgi:L-threonylcarbamoyladenylate synthase|tara:strand:- start:794 stop:1399 length:606 start_codon:yes stop_codon:yes gene_type:complete